MEILIRPDAGAVAGAAAAFFRRQLREKPASVLGLATGSTPLLLYRRLAGMVAAGEADFAQAVTFNLDEYAGLPGSHPQSCSAYMRAHFFAAIPVAAHHLPDGTAADMQDADALFGRYFFS